MSASSQFSGHRDRFLRKFPHAETTERALRTQANPTPFFYFSPCQDVDLRGCWWVLGRVGLDLERQFSIAGEMLFLYTPYEDLQRRTFNVLTDRLRNEVRGQQISVWGAARFTPDPTVSLLWAPDPDMKSKLEAWNLEAGGPIVAPLPPSSTELSPQKAWIARSLHNVLAARDLYRGRNPVTGNDFFGRQETLLSLRSELSAGRSIGLFGLRRSGKTSVVREFQRRSKGAGTAVVLSDLEAIGDIVQMPAQLAGDLTNVLREMKDADPSVWVGSEHEQRVTNPAELGARLVRVAEKNRTTRFVIALDEIESLVPLVATSPQDVRLFLGSLRRAAQATNNLALLLTGVTTRFFDESMLAEGVENPLFGFVEEHFLRPFSLDETTNLVRKLGRGMVLEWTDEALELLHVSSGGFPFLVRDLASAVRRTAVGGSGAVVGIEPLAITSDIVEETLPDWSEPACRLWTEIVRTLETHHPLHAEMVRCADSSELAEWLRVGAEAEAAAKSLESLGLLVHEGGTWAPSSTLSSLQKLGTPSSVEVDAVRESVRQRVGAAERVRQLSAMPEGPTLEFKTTARFNIHTRQADKALELPIVKTVAAFLNSRGGTLLIGVQDDGTVAGISNDLKLCQGSVDKFQLFLQNLLATTLGSGAVSRFVEVRLPSVDGNLVCEVQVQPASEPVWCNLNGDDVLFVRNGNETRKLPNRDFLTYAQDRFPGRPS